MQGLAASSGEITDCSLLRTTREADCVCEIDEERRRPPVGPVWGLYHGNMMLRCKRHTPSVGIKGSL